MKQRYLVFLIILLAAAVLFNALPASADILKDSKNDYSLKYPSTWAAKTYPDSNNLVIGDISKGDEAGVNIRIYPSGSRSFDDFIKWYANNFIKEIKGRWGGKMDVIYKSYAQIAGRRGYIITFDYTREDGKRWILKEYLIPKNNDEIFVFQAGSEYENKDVNMGIIDKIISSLKIKGN